MRSLVQSVRRGDLRLVELPTAPPGPSRVAVRVHRSVVSAGTELAVRQLSSASLIGKAARSAGVGPPDHGEGGGRRCSNAPPETVATRLDEEIGLGYSAAGVVVEVGEAVSGLVPGQRVATGGEGHAEMQSVAANLTVPIPDDVSLDEAAFATIGSIALQGLRLAELSPGSRVCIIGLGLIGQLTARLAAASGFEVVGIDVNPWNVERLGANGIGLLESGAATTDAVLSLSRGPGVDAVLITAASRLISTAPAGARSHSRPGHDRGRRRRRHGAAAHTALREGAHDPGGAQLRAWSLRANVRGVGSRLSTRTWCDGPPGETWRRSSICSPVAGSRSPTSSPTAFRSSGRPRPTRSSSHGPSPISASSSSTTRRLASGDDEPSNSRRGFRQEPGSPFSERATTYGRPCCRRSRRLDSTGS